METLKNLLIAISSQDPRGLANAEQQLKSLETQPGFHSALLVSFFFTFHENFFKLIISSSGECM